MNLQQNIFYNYRTHNDLTDIVIPELQKRHTQMELTSEYEAPSTTIVYAPVNLAKEQNHFLTQAAIEFNINENNGIFNVLNFMKNNFNMAAAKDIWHNDKLNTVVKNFIINPDNIGIVDKSSMAVFNLFKMNYPYLSKKAKVIYLKNLFIVLIGVTLDYRKLVTNKNNVDFKDIFDNHQKFIPEGCLPLLENNQEQVNNVIDFIERNIYDNSNIWLNHIQTVLDEETKEPCQVSFTGQELNFVDWFEDKINNVQIPEIPNFREIFEKAYEVFSLKNVFTDFDGDFSGVGCDFLIDRFYLTLFNPIEETGAISEPAKLAYTQALSAGQQMFQTLPEMAEKTVFSAFDIVCKHSDVDKILDLDKNNHENSTRYVFNIYSSYYKEGSNHLYIDLPACLIELVLIVALSTANDLLKYSPHGLVSQQIICSYAYSSHHHSSQHVTRGLGLNGDCPIAFVENIKHVLINRMAANKTYLAMSPEQMNRYLQSKVLNQFFNTSKVNYIHYLEKNQQYIAKKCAETASKNMMSLLQILFSEKANITQRPIPKSILALHKAQDYLYDVFDKADWSNKNNLNNQNNKQPSSIQVMSFNISGGRDNKYFKITSSHDEGVYSHYCAKINDDICQSNYNYMSPYFYYYPEYQLIMRSNWLYQF